MKSVAGKSWGSPPTSIFKASTPPAEVPTTMMSCPGMSCSLGGGRNHREGLRPVPLVLHWQPYLQTSRRVRHTQGKDGDCSRVAPGLGRAICEGPPEHTG